MNKKIVVIGLVLLSVVVVAGYISSKTIFVPSTVPTSTVPTVKSLADPLNLTPDSGLPPGLNLSYKEHDVIPPEFKKFGVHLVAHGVYLHSNSSKSAETYIIRCGSDEGAKGLLNECQNIYVTEWGWNTSKQVMLDGQSAYLSEGLMYGTGDLHIYMIEWSNGHYYLCAQSMDKEIANGLANAINNQL